MVEQQIKIKKLAANGDIANQVRAAIKVAKSRAVHPDHIVMRLDAMSDHYDFSCLSCDERIRVSGMEACCG